MRADRNGSPVLPRGRNSVVSRTRGICIVCWQHRPCLFPARAGHNASPVLLRDRNWVSFCTRGARIFCWQHRPCLFPARAGHNASPILLRGHNWVVYRTLRSRIVCWRHRPCLVLVRAGHNASPVLLRGHNWESSRTRRSRIVWIRHRSSQVPCIFHNKPLSLRILRTSVQISCICISGACLPFLQFFSHVKHNIFSLWCLRAPTLRFYRRNISRPRRFPNLGVCAIRNTPAFPALLHMKPVFYIDIPVRPCIDKGP